MRRSSKVITSPLWVDHPAHDNVVRRSAWLREVIATALSTIPATRSLSADERLRRSTSIVAQMDGPQAQWVLDETIDMPAAFHSYLVTIGLVAPEQHFGQAALASAG